MQRIAVFDIDQQDKCNKFLAANKPASLSTRDGKIVIFYDDGSYPAAYQIADLKEHLQSVQAARFQQEVALHVAKAELADLNPTHNKGRYDEIAAAIHKMEDAIHIQNIKEGFVQGRIEELSVANN